MSSYPIQRWDAVKNVYYPSTHDNIPALYIQPTPSLMKYLREQQFKIPIKITNTHTSYDNQFSMAKCVPSQEVAGSRPNFQAKTGYIVILPDISWESYPKTLGKIHTLAPPPMEIKPPVTVPLPDETSVLTPPPPPIRKDCMSIELFLFLFLFLIVLWKSFSKKN